MDPCLFFFFPCDVSFSHRWLSSHCMLHRAQLSHVKKKERDTQRRRHREGDTDRQRQRETHRERHTERETQRGRHRQTETERHTEGDTQRETQRGRHRQTETERDAERERHRERHREISVAKLAQAISCSNERGVFPVYERFWFCLVQVSATQFCCFPPSWHVRIMERICLSILKCADISVTCLLFEYGFP